MTRSGDWSLSTVQQTRWIIDGQLRGLSERRLGDLRVEDLDRFYAALRERGGRGGRRLAGSTVARIHTVVRSALGQAVVWGWRADNPADRANPGRYHAAEIKPPSAEEVRRLFDAAFEKDLELLTFVALEAEPGARRGELAALRYPDFAEGCVSITAPWSWAWTVPSRAPAGRRHRDGRPGRRRLRRPLTFRGVSRQTLT